MVKLAYKGKEYINGSNVYLGKTITKSISSIECYNLNFQDSGLYSLDAGTKVVGQAKNGNEMYIMPSNHSFFFKVSDIVKSGGVCSDLLSHWYQRLASLLRKVALA